MEKNACFSMKKKTQAQDKTLSSYHTPFLKSTIHNVDMYENYIERIF